MAIASIELQQDYLLLQPVEIEANACVYKVVMHGPDVETPVGAYVVLNEHVGRGRLKVGDDMLELTSSRNVVGVVELAATQTG
jgi:hypothetical protein